MKVGRRLFYDLTTGNVVCDTGEREGDVIVTDPANDMAAFPDLKTRTSATTGHVDVVYGDSRFLPAYGSAVVDPQTQNIIVYALATIATDKTQVTANGTDTATVTVSGLSNTDPVNFSVNGGTANAVNPNAGQAVLSFNTQVQGEYTITAQTSRNGTVSVVIQGV